MRTLVIDTATAACSVALIEGDRVIAATHDRVGRGHAERLVLMIAELPNGGRADRIAVDCGPGSFTGIRVGLAAALGLGLGWGIGVQGYSSLALLAAAHFADCPAETAVAAILEGGHGEVFVQQFTSAPLSALTALASLAPQAAIAALGGRTGIGSGVRLLAAVDDDLPLIDALPNAADFILLPPTFAALPPRPIYGRAPDAVASIPKTGIAG
jgi:tRNA threonylcarbamoyl adenosine modification protein YeaZ